MLLMPLPFHIVCRLTYLCYFFPKYLDCPVKKYITMTEFPTNTKLRDLILCGTNSAPQGSITVAAVFREECLAPHQAFT